MAETRKYDPAAGNAIAQALRAQLGEGIRPRLPGEAAHADPAKATPRETTTWVNLSFTAPAAPVEDPEDDA
jgi:hypothetical protein